MCSDKEVKQAADLLQVIYAVGKPGDEPAEGKIGWHFCTGQMVMDFFISLYSKGQEACSGSGAARGVMLLGMSACVGDGLLLDQGRRLNRSVLYEHDCLLF